MVAWKVWTAKQEDELRRLWDGRFSLNRIAMAMGMTRSAVCGKVRRLNLEYRQGTGIQIIGVVRTPNKKAKRSIRFGSAVEPLPKHHVSITHVGHGKCRYPYGEAGRDMMLCGDTAVPHTSWCAYHLRKVAA